MRTLSALIVAALLLQGCTLVNVDLQPRIHALEEETVEGKGKAKILLLDVSGVLSDETGGLVLGTPPPRVPIVARVREELQKAEEDDTVNAQGLMEKIGVAPLAIKSGEMKDAGSPFRTLTPQERAVFQTVIDDMYGRFVTLIARSRKIPEDRVRTFADGRIYTAEQ